MKKKMQLLFNNLCCSHCKSSFDDESIIIKREEAGLIVTSLVCQHCGKNFGVAFLGFSNIEIKDENTLPLEIQEGPEPINYDDVLDAHKFIQNMDENWQKHLPQA